MKIYESISDLIGNTPLLKLNNYASNNNIDATILAKLEYFNPAGSVKDRVAFEIINNAVKSGKIDKNTTIIEPTSGNTGIGLASVCAANGYKLIIVMPETMSVERQNLIKAYGAKIVLTDGSKGMSGAIDKANEIHSDIPNSFIAGQFTNPINPKTHFDTTGPEIYKDTDGNIDIFIAGVGTGGTISGVGKYLKSKNPNIKVVAVEPLNSPVLSNGTSGSHRIQGIGAGFIPDTLDTGIYDEVVRVSDAAALATGKELARCEGFLAGISSGAALYAAKQISERCENRDKTIVVLFPDNGERYLSTDMFRD